jgi:hypothetical protein
MAPRIVTNLSEKSVVDYRERQQHVRSSVSWTRPTHEVWLGVRTALACTSSPAPSQSSSESWNHRQSGTDMAQLNVAIVSALLSVAPLADSQSSFDQSRADRLVQALGEFAASLPGIGRSDGTADPAEERRRRVYTQLRELGTEALPALARGLADPEVQIRRNVVPALIRLLADPDEGARNSACIGLTGIGPPAKEALPALRKTVSDPSKDVRRFAQRAIGTIDAQR